MSVVIPDGMLVHIEKTPVRDETSGLIRTVHEEHRLEPIDVHRKHRSELIGPELRRLDRQLELRKIELQRVRAERDTAWKLLDAVRDQLNRLTRERDVLRSTAAKAAAPLHLCRLPEPLPGETAERYVAALRDFAELEELKGAAEPVLWVLPPAGGTPASAKTETPSDGARVDLVRDQEGQVIGARRTDVP